MVDVASAGDILATLYGKEPKLARYRPNKANEVWLLVVCDLFSEGLFIDPPTERASFVIRSGFDRVFCLEWTGARAVEIPLDTPRTTDRGPRSLHTAPDVVRACSRAARSDPRPVASSSVSDSSPHTDDSAVGDNTEVAALRTTGGKVSRLGSELRIQLLNGRTAVFKDDSTEGLSFALPRYAGYLKAIRSHVLHILQYEGSGAYLIVDDSTGDSTIVFSKPIASPDGKRFVLTSLDLIAGHNANMIEVRRVVGRKPEKEFSYDTDTSDEPWGPSDAVWRDSATMDFIKNSSIDPSEPYIKTPGRLIRIGTTWTPSELSR